MNSLSAGREVTARALREPARHERPGSAVAAIYAELRSRSKVREQAPAT